MAELTLTTLTPVHIGSGQKLLRDFDFVSQGDEIGFLNLEKIVDLIGVDSIGSLTAVIEKKSSILSFLNKGRGFKDIPLHKICDRVAINKSKQSTANELKEHYRTSLMGLCIPGSSLKGAIKTAILTNLATAEAQNAWNEATYGLMEGDRIKKYFYDKIDSKLFGKDANTKSTRFLHVSDINFPGIKSIIVETGIFNKKHNGWQFKHGNSFLTECIPSKTSGNIILNLKPDWMKMNIKKYPEKWHGVSSDFINKGIIDFFLELNKYMSKQLGYEINDLVDNEFDQDDPGNDMIENLREIKAQVEQLIKNQAGSAILRVGGHNGWNFTTGGWMKASNISDENYDKLRRDVQKRDYDMKLWPKTRKMTLLGVPLGFVKISLA